MKKEEKEEEEEKSNLSSLQKSPPNKKYKMTRLRSPTPNITPRSNEFLFCN